MGIDRKILPLNNLVVVSDIHAGCRMALCPPEGALLDEAIRVMPSPIQNKMWAHWLEFRTEFIPEVVRGQPYGVVINGDGINGNPHDTNVNITTNWDDQIVLAHRILEPLCASAMKLDKGRRAVWYIRGTEAHGGKSGQHEETLAKLLNALPHRETKKNSRWQLWKRVGPHRHHLAHITHHIGVTGSMAYEHTALSKEVTESLAEAARWNYQPPKIVVRAHRHRYAEAMFAAAGGRAIGVVTPAWQLRSGYSWRNMARCAPPQLGGVIIRYHKGELYTRAFFKDMQRPEVE